MIDEKDGIDEFVPAGAVKAEATEKNKGGRPRVTQEMLSGGDPKVTQKTKEYLQKERLIRIKIPSTETEKGDVSVGVNGHTYLIQRDKEVEVPKSVLDVLNNATKPVTTQEKRTTGEGFDLVSRDVLRFPYVTV